MEQNPESPLLLTFGSGGGQLARAPRSVFGVFRASEIHRSPEEKTLSSTCWQVYLHQCVNFRNVIE